jgi:hypothetical protein
MLAIVSGGVLLTWQPGEARFSPGAILIVGGLPLLGSRQQPDAQGRDERRRADRPA